jgi:hypothetical protein
MWPLNDKFLLKNKKEGNGDRKPSLMYQLSF